MTDALPPASPSIPPTEPTAPTGPQGLSPQARLWLIIGVIVVIAIVIGLVFAVFGMAANPQQTAVFRDIVIIFMAVESLFIGLALIILMIQIARLTNLLQHEIKPILQNTNETINTVRGTTIFVSENLVEPVMKLNGYLAAISKFFELITLIKK